MNRFEDRSISDLLTAIRSDAPIKISLLYQLSDLTPEELNQFGDAWQHVDDERRRVVVRHLADITEENFTVDFSEIFAMCLSDSAAEVRMAALDGLWDCDRLSLIQPIVVMMQSDTDSLVRATAAATLGHYVLMAEWDQIPMDQVRGAVEALLEQFDNEQVEPPIRRAAIESLGASSDPRVPSLIQGAYDHGNREMRLSALFAMGRSADPRWVGRVQESMMSDSVETRLEAARAAGGIGDKLVVSDLAGLVYDEDYGVRLAAVDALGKIGDLAARRVLDELMNDPDAEDISEAVEEALLEMSWLGEDLDLSIFKLDDE